MGCRLLRYEELKEAGIPWTRMHLARLEEAGKFPRRLFLGPKTIAWSADEIDEFLAQKVAERGSGRAADR